MKKNVWEKNSWQKRRVTSQVWVCLEKGVRKLPSTEENGLCRTLPRQPGQVVSKAPRSLRSGSKPYLLQDLDDSGFEPNAYDERILRQLREPACACFIFSLN